MPRIPIHPATLRRSILMLALVTTLPGSLLACEDCGGRAKADTSSRAPQPPSVVGTVGGHDITRAEVEAHASAELASLDQQRDAVLRRHLDTLVTERLLEAEAEARGTDVTTLRQREIGDRLAPVGDAEIQAFYEANRARIRQPLETVRADIQRHLVAQQTQAQTAEYVATLTDRYPVRIDWQPYRFDVASSSAPFKGMANAPIDVVVFSDFECPWCSRFAPELEKLTERYPEEVRLTYRHLPLNSIHPSAQAAAEASVCAAEQDAFWPTHDAIFAKQTELARVDYAELARELELDTEAFNACLASDLPTQRVAADVAVAADYGITTTPSLFVNGRKVNLTKGRPIFDQIADVVREELTQESDG